MPKSEVTVKTRDVERNTPIKQQNVEEKTEEEMSESFKNGNHQQDFFQLFLREKNSCIYFILYYYF